MFEDTAMALVECPETGDAEETAAKTSGNTMTWRCSQCGEEHSTILEYDDDAAWYDDNEMDGEDCD